VKAVLIKSHKGEEQRQLWQHSEMPDHSELVSH